MKVLKKIIPVILLILIGFFAISYGGKKPSHTAINNSNAVASKDIDNNKVSDKNNKVEPKDDNESNKEEESSDATKTQENKDNSANKNVDKPNKKTENNSSTKENKPNVENPKLDKPTVEEDKNKKDSFTLIIAKELKGYTGKQSEILIEKEVEIWGNKNAMTYLRENSDMRDKGGFIYEINGLHNIYPIPASKKTSEQKELGILGIDWFIYLNGEKTPVGANDVYPKAGDKLLFDFHEWDKRELAPDAY